MRVAGARHQAIEKLPKTRAALDCARRLHAGQSREIDGAPFIVHPREVALILYRAGAPDDLIAAGALHDAIEKGSATESDLRERFGGRVASLVLAVSEDSRIKGYRARKKALREQVAAAGYEALTLYAADKLAKARELRLEDRGRTSDRSPDLSSKKYRRRLEHYQKSLELLRARLPGSPLVEQLQAELDDLSAGMRDQWAPVA
jgi:(p)ppGpp synthase/HD superfamily hydrolase